MPPLALPHWVEAFLSVEARKFNGVFVDSAGKIREANGRYARTGETVDRLGDSFKRTTREGEGLTRSFGGFQSRNRDTSVFKPKPNRFNLVIEILLFSSEKADVGDSVYLRFQSRNRDTSLFKLCIVCVYAYLLP